MRKITVPQILIFSVLLSVAVGSGVYATSWLMRLLPTGEFRGISAVILAIVLIYGAALVLYRLFLRVYPLRPGLIEPGSTEEFGYHIYLLFYFILFHPLTRSLLLPVPLMRLVYLALGARLGANSYSAGTILDPPLTRLGDNSLIGHDAVLFCHAIEGSHLSHAPISIGHNVTIGAKAVIMSGVTIGDGAVVAVSAVVKKNTSIGAGELWGGIPARKLGLVADMTDGGATGCDGP